MKEPHWNIGSCIQLYLKFSYRVQLLLPHVWETTLPSTTHGFGPCTIMEPNTSKFVQKIRECIRWAQKKAEAFQAKEAQRHKCNYNKKGRGAALEGRDTVLVHVTTFKCHHKNTGSMGELGICCGKAALSQCASLCGMPQGWGRCSWTLHRNCLLPT